MERPLSASREFLHRRRDFVTMLTGTHVFEHPRNEPIPADDERRALDPHVLLPHERLQPPHAVRLGDVMVHIREQGMRDVLLRAEFPV